MVDFLLEGGYVRALALHLGALALFTLWGAARAVRGLDRRDLAAWLGAILVSGTVAWSLPARPAVYYDEFFYVAIARNMATTGRAEPLVWTGWPPRPRPTGHFQPPYPQGWPFLLALAVGPDEAPQAGRVEEPAWGRAVLVSRMLLAALAPLAFLAAVRRFRWPLALAGSLALVALPLVLRLSGSAGAENGSLFCIVLALLALESFLRRPDSFGLGWLVLASTAVGEMRPEGLFYVLALMVLAWPSVRALSWRVRGAWSVVLGLLAAPPLIVMGSHDPSLAHHFQAIPRGGFTVWGNRLANLENNALYFLVNRLWPLPLTLLALVGLGSASPRPLRSPAAAAAGWVVAITLFLSWYPFGDYGAVNSLDTWRFGHHVAVPMLMLALLGARTLVLSGRVGALVAGMLFLWALASPWVFRDFLQEPHPLAPQDDLVATARRELGAGVVAAEAPEYACFLRYRHGLPAILAPVVGVPSGGLLLFAVDEGRGLPDLDAWSRFELDPLDLEQEVRPAAALFRVRSGSR